MLMLDHYLLKSLDGISEETVMNINITFDPKKKTYTLYPTEEATQIGGKYHDLQRPWAFRVPYDEVIYATGFMFECGIFSEEICGRLLLNEPNRKKKKYPVITNRYAAKHVENMYFMGALAHSVDHKKSAGGFIHGFRYLIKAVFHEMVQKSFEDTKISVPLEEITKHIMLRINTASSYYQMFGVMADVIVIRDDHDAGRYADYYYDVLMAQLSSVDVLSDTPDPCRGVITVTFDYEESFHGHDTVLHDPDRVVEDYRQSQDSKFLHPVLRYYECEVLSTRMDYSYQDLKDSKFKLSEKHIIEDFLTLWDSDKFHVDWLAKWIEKITSSEQMRWQYSSQDLHDAYEQFLSSASKMFHQDYFWSPFFCTPSDEMPMYNPTNN